MKTRILVVATLTAALAACSSVPERNSALDQARDRYASAQANQQINALASAELKRAGESLRVAEKAMADDSPVATVDHLAYMTAQRVAIAELTASARASQAITAGASAERDAMRLSMRTAEADAAQRQLAQSQQDAQRQLAQSQQDAQRDAMRLSMRTAEADAAQRQLAQSQQDAQRQLAQSQQDAQRDAMRLSMRTAEAEAAQRQLAQSQEDAQRQLAQSQQDVQRSDARISSLESELKELNAKETPRGMVVTLGDFLFRTGESKLQPASANALAKLADFFKRNPERTASIEGHTDSVGSANANYVLSERRANAVMTALVRQGVPADRLRTQAFGEDNPIASNDNETGRQMNRRVEIVFPQ